MEPTGSPPLTGQKFRYGEDRLRGTWRIHCGLTFTKKNYGKSQHNKRVSLDLELILLLLLLRDQSLEQQAEQAEDLAEMEKPRARKEKFSLFGSRSTCRATNPPSSSFQSSSPGIPSATVGKRTDRISGSGPAALSKAEFLERVRHSNQACQQGEFALAVGLYTEALTTDPQNCILYSNRSAAYLRLGQYGKALDDAIKARLINPKWPKKVVSHVIMI
ncbi:hypothetical protein CRENBAI_016711 [Crenichthys baileyi]|uniref:Tetratricopeptide repeat protein 28 n=1 Tax=Crenichthys baileyi TaxID=28760 RepID=A0AAV9RCD3_9TELE